MKIYSIVEPARRPGELNMEVDPPSHECGHWPEGVGYSCKPLNRKASTPNLERTLAIVCDDFKPSACRLAQIIEDEGFETLCVSDGWHAMQILENWIVDLLVIDILMPGLGDLETISRIREMNLKTKVVAVSGGPAEYLAAARRMGASMTFSKPVSTWALRDYARRLNTAASGDPGG